MRHGSLVTFEVAYAETADEDINRLYGWISDHSDPIAANDYIARVHRACAALAEFPNRGTPRDDLAPGLRSIVVERKTVIIYEPRANRVRILRVLHRGRNIGLAFNDL
jgi:toxin ParE1/3/4